MGMCGFWSSSDRKSKALTTKGTKAQRNTQISRAGAPAPHERAMKISPQWLRDFVDLDVNYHQLADDLTLAGIAVESVNGEGDGTIFEMDITTNRPDAMNHYGVARE